MTRAIRVTIATSTATSVVARPSSSSVVLLVLIHRAIAVLVATGVTVAER